MKVGNPPFSVGPATQTFLVFFLSRWLGSPKVRYRTKDAQKINAESVVYGRFESHRTNRCSTNGSRMRPPWMERVASQCELTFFVSATASIFTVQNDYFIQSFRSSCSSPSSVASMHVRLIRLFPVRIQHSSKWCYKPSENCRYIYFTHHFCAFRSTVAEPTSGRLSRRPILCRLANKFIYFSPQVCGFVRFVFSFFLFSVRFSISSEQWWWSRLLYHSLRLTACSKNVAEASYHRNGSSSSRAPHMFCNFTCRMAQIMNTQSLRVDAVLVMAWLVIFF